MARRKQSNLKFLPEKLHTLVSISQETRNFLKIKYINLELTLVSARLKFKLTTALCFPVVMPFNHILISLTVEVIAVTEVVDYQVSQL